MTPRWLEMMPRAVVAEHVILHQQQALASGNYAGERIPAEDVVAMIGELARQTREALAVPVEGGG